MPIPQQILDAAYAKKGVEREDYLIEVLETIYCTLDAVIDTLPSEAEALPPQQQHVLRMLILNAGKTISKDCISEHIAAIYDKQEGPCLKQIALLVCHIRRAIPESFGRIETMWGQGYRFIPAANA